MSWNRLLICARKSHHNGILKRFGSFEVIAAVLMIAAPVMAQQPGPISRMAAKESAARTQDIHFSYLSEERSPRTGGQLWREKVVETDDGILRRLLGINGKPLSQTEADAENKRINDLVAHPESFRKLYQSHRNEEIHATQLLELLPKAFLIAPDGEVDGCTRFSIRPNPNFQPSTYEERVAHVMTGTVSIKEPVERLCKLDAEISQDVEFGFGILGRIDHGGHFSLVRKQVDDSNWKTAEISVHVSGRILLLKSLAREQEAVRNDIHVVPKQLTLAQAAEMSRP
jgi:hypothetical protein